MDEGRGMKNHRLIEIDWPEFGGGERPLPVTLAEFEARLGALRWAMERRRLRQLVVYEDREHFRQPGVPHHDRPRVASAGPAPFVAFQIPSQTARCSETKGAVAQ